MNNYIKTCGTCKKEIVYTITRKGASMPTDLNSIPPDEVEKIKKGEKINFRFGEHISHFSTCSDPGKYRKNKK